jgi:hypothetical protein
MSVEDSSIGLRYSHLFLNRSTKFTKRKIIVNLKKNRHYLSEFHKFVCMTKITVRNLNNISQSIRRMDAIIADRSVRNKLVSL